MDGRRSQAVRRGRTPRTRPRRRSRGAGLLTATALFIASAAVSQGPAAPSPAAAQGGFESIVHVDATAHHTRGANFQPDFSPPLPPGWSWSGSLGCINVVVDNVQRQLAQVGHTLDVGDYAMRNCSLSDSFQVRDENGTVQAFTAVDVVDGVFRVSKAETGLEVDVTNTGNGSIEVISRVRNFENEDATVVGAQVALSYQMPNGLHALGCVMTTEWVDPDQQFLGSIGECTIPAADVLAGTGAWSASYAGTANFHGANANGYLEDGLTAIAEAEHALSLMEPVEIVADYVPPGCYIEPEPNASLIGISVSVVSQNCTALKVLQIGAEIVTSLFPSPGGFITNFFFKIASKVQLLKALKYVKTFRAGLQRPVSVIIP